MREACFVCSSPYQVIGVLGIQLKLRLDADIFIFSSFPDYDRLAEKLEGYGLFRRVYPIDLSEIGLRGRWRVLKETVLAKPILKRFLPKDAAYAAYYFSSRGSLKTAMLKVLSDRNPEMKRVVYEDGMGTYSDSASLLNASASRRFLEKALAWDLDDPGKTSFMAYLPELVHYPAPYDRCAVEQMPRLPLDDQTRKMFCDLFSIRNESEIREKFIIFDTKRWDKERCNSDQLQLLDQCYQIVLDTAGRDNVILKPHPRSTKELQSGIRVYPNKGVPMEAIYAVMPDMRDRILISFVSSAVFTPKILLDEEPVVICLHRIVTDNRNSRVFDGIFEKFRNTYRQPERVLAPASIEELRQRLRSRSDLQSGI